MDTIPPCVNSLLDALFRRDGHNEAEKTGLCRKKRSKLLAILAALLLVLPQIQGEGCRIAGYCRDMEKAMLSFKWKQFKQSIILMAARWYLPYAISYRDIEELMAEAFFRKAIGDNILPEKVVIDKSRGNKAALDSLNLQLALLL